MVCSFSSSAEVDKLTEKNADKKGIYGRSIDLNRETAMVC